MSKKPTYEELEQRIRDLERTKLEFKHVEEALAEQNRLMTVLLDNLKVGVFMVEAPSGKPLLANRTAMELLGRGIVSGSCLDTLAEVYKAYKVGTNEYYPIDQMPIFRGLQGQSHAIDDLLVIHPGGKKILLEIFGSPVWDEKGKVIACLVSFSDITERKSAEEERDRLQAQFQQSQKMESIGRLAGGIAHNFNNILMSIQGYASLIEIGKAPSHPDLKYLHNIKEAVRRAVGLTRNLLGFAKGGKYETKLTDLNALIRDENNTFGHMKKEIQIHEKFEEKLWQVEVDQVQIQQALLNLYVNAWQAMPKGGHLYVQTENATLEETFTTPYELTPGRYVKISVTDTGTGIDEGTQKKIFDPFFTTKEIGNGSGLGLASVYGIVKNHQGIIDVHSEVGKGSTFNIYLPSFISKPKDIVPVLYQSEIQYGQGTVLFVDDEDMILDVGKKMLESLGYKVLTAQNGREAMDIYSKKYDEIDLVILDIIMPVMDGGETFDRMKMINNGVKVLLSSGYSINGKAREIMDRGCRKFIQKPFSLYDLSIKIRETLE